MNPQEVARTYIDTWNATDPARRTRLLDAGWKERARYVDPLMAGDGRAQIERLVAGVHERFPGFRFTLLGTPDGHGEHVRLAWSLGPEGAEPPIKGSDVIELEDGRIARVIGFLDQVPATP